jgi:excisionase family DNA binding protein
MITARYIGIKELSEYLGLAKGTIYIWVCHKKIPYLKVGKLVKFDLVEVEEWLKDKRIKELDLTKLNSNV